MEVEVRLLVDQLTQYGVLTKEDLARQAKANLWDEGTFEAALRAGAARGAFRLLADDLVALPDR